MNMHTTPINSAAHAFLLAHGYTYTHQCTFEDDGDAENGPHLTGGEWDEYESAEDRVFINAYDGAADFAVRDLQLEAWCDEQAGGNGQ